MSLVAELSDAVTDGLTFVGITVFWLAVIAIVYGAFVAVLPDIPEAEPWIFLGVYLIPLIGFRGHTLAQALKVGQS